MFVFSEIPFRHSFWVFQASTTCQKLQVPDSGSTLHLLCIMVASCPSLRCSYRKGMCLMQRSRVFGHGVMASRFVTILWLWSQLWCEIASNQKTLVEIELLATVGWKWGCQPFSCRCSQNVTHCPKEICSTSLSKESIPTIPFGNLNHPLPARSFRFLRAAVRSTCFALWLHHAHPVAWKTCLIEISRGFGHGVRVSKICYNTVIVLWVVLSDCCKPMNTCRDWAFSNSGLEVGLPAFQLPMFAKCDTLPKGDLFDMFVFRNPFPPFLLGISIIHSLPEAGSWERQYAPPASHYGCIMPIPSLQLHEKPVS